jgi:hypothetical protein
MRNTMLGCMHDTVTDFRISIKLTVFELIYYKLYFECIILISWT